LRPYRPPLHPPYLPQVAGRSGERVYPTTHVNAVYHVMAHPHHFSLSKARRQHYLKEFGNARSLVEAYCCALFVSSSSSANDNVDNEEALDGVDADDESDLIGAEDFLLYKEKATGMQRRPRPRDLGRARTVRNHDLSEDFLSIDTTCTATREVLLNRQNGNHGLTDRDVAFLASERQKPTDLQRPQAICPNVLAWWEVR